MTREAILKQMNELYLVHTQPTLTIFKDGTIKSEVRWTESEAKKLFHVLQKYLVEQQRWRPSTDTALEIKYLQPAAVPQKLFDIFNFCASELDRVCGLEALTKARLSHDEK